MIAIVFYLMNHAINFKNMFSCKKRIKKKAFLFYDFTPCFSYKYIFLLSYNYIKNIFLKNKIIKLGQANDQSYKLDRLI
jgi:hypothetical protein